MNEIDWRTADYWAEKVSAEKAMREDADLQTKRLVCECGCVYIGANLHKACIDCDAELMREGHKSMERTDYDFDMRKDAFGAV